MIFLVKHTKFLAIIELGSCLGHFTCHFADLLGIHGKVFACDHWLGSVKH